MNYGIYLTLTIFGFVIAFIVFDYIKRVLETKREARRKKPIKKNVKKKKSVWIKII